MAFKPKEIYFRFKRQKSAAILMKPGSINVKKQQDPNICHQLSPWCRLMQIAFHSSIYRKIQLKISKHLLTTRPLWIITSRTKLPTLSLTLFPNNLHRNQFRTSCSHWFHHKSCSRSFTLIPNYLTKWIVKFIAFNFVIIVGFFW